MKDNRNPLFEILFELDNIKGQIKNTQDKIAKMINQQSNSEIKSQTNINSKSKKDAT